MRTLASVLGVTMLLGACGGASRGEAATGYVRGFLAAAVERDWAKAWTFLHPITQAEMFDGDPGALDALCGGQSFGYPWGVASSVVDDAALWRVEIALPAGPAGLPACLTDVSTGHALADAGGPGQPRGALLWHVRLDSEGGSGIQASN